MVVPTDWNGGAGTVFKMTTSGVLTTLVDFGVTNGANPYARLTWGHDGNIYGTTANGGSDSVAGSSSGTLFRVTTNGTLTTLVNFNNATNGAYPWGELTLGSDGSFYGTTIGGGKNLDGTVFKLTLLPTPIPLNIQLLSGNAVLSWTNAAFKLQSAPEVTGTFTNIAGAASPYTNPVTGNGQFFRLIAN